MGNIIEFGKKNIKNIAMAAVGALLVGMSAKNVLATSSLDDCDEDEMMIDYENEKVPEETDFKDSTDETEG